MLVSEFAKSLYNGCNSKKNTAKIKIIFYFFIYKWNFIHEKMFLKIKNKVEYDRYDPDLPDETIKMLNFPFSQKLWWKNCWNLPKLLRCRKASKLSNLSFPKSEKHKFKTWLKIVSKSQIPIFCTFEEINRQRTSRSGRFIVFVIQRILNGHTNLFQYFTIFFFRFYSCLHVVEATSI